MTADLRPLTIRADARLRTTDGLRTLVGGVPVRVIRVSDRGAALVKSWFRGEPVGVSEGERSLAARLLEAGLAHPAISSGGSSSLTVVIPVKDDSVGLATTLEGLGHHEPDQGLRADSSPPPVVVVDDGSAAPVGGLGVSCDGTREPSIIRLPSPCGPAAARNRGASRVDTDLIAFVDAGVRLQSDQLARLTSHFDDADVIAVAPRVRSRPGPSRLDRYERVFSPLDLGPRPGPVGPGRALTYVPSACLLVRRDAFEAAGGFDESLRFGEDVDLVWRFGPLGRVLYAPDVEVEHAPRSSWSAWFRQRLGYGSAAGPLARRHGSQVAPWQVSPWSATAVAIALGGNVVAASVVAAAPLPRLARSLSALDEPNVEAGLMLVRGHGWALRSLAENAARTWLAPMLVVATVARRPRRPLALIAAGWARRGLQANGPVCDRLATALIGVADDAAYGIGVWKGSFRAGTFRAVLPRFLT